MRYKQNYEKWANTKNSQNTNNWQQFKILITIISYINKNIKNKGTSCIMQEV